MIGTSPYLNDVEKLMVGLVHGDGFSRMGEILEGQLATGGKRLRARLALSASECFGGRAETAVPWAAACELLHNGTLIHDDIQDGDRLRRGKPTVWVLHGEAQAINAGDLMFMLPFSALAELKAGPEVKWKLSLALAKGAQQVVRGQSFEAELFSVCDLARGYGEYIRCVREKTAALFRLPVEGAALLSGLSSDSSARLAEAFEELGVLFQMQDDVLDLYGTKGRNLPGQDLREGKISCLVVEHMKRNPHDRKWLKELLAKSREETTDGEVRIAIDKFASEGTLDAVLQKMMDLVNTVRQNPGLKKNRALRELALTLAVTMLEPIERVFTERGLAVSL